MIAPEVDDVFRGKMTQLLKTDMARRVFTYQAWEGIHWPKVDIQLRAGAPPYLHAKVRNIPKMLFEPARTSITKLVADNILRMEHETLTIYLCSLNPECCHMYYC